MDTTIPPPPIVTRKRYFILIAVALFCIGLISWAGSVKPGSPAQDAEVPEVPALAVGALTSVHLD